MSIERLSPCKVNLVLNVLGRRPDGFHELETVMHPIPWTDRLELARGGSSIELSCNRPDLPTDTTNLVVRAALAFRDAAHVADGVRIRLEKRIPLAAGLGGGSSNAATTLLGLNDLFGRPLDPARIQDLAAALGSDVPFFLHATPALATGRGEKIEPLDWFPALSGCWVLLVHPGFGIPTAWAYRELARFPAALNGEAGRARRAIAVLRSEAALVQAQSALYNSLEAPAFAKYPILEIYLDFMRSSGAIACRMSGSGSATFALFLSEGLAREAQAAFAGRFGETCWVQVIPLVG